MSDDEGQDCQRMGLAIAMQRQAINVAIAQHEETKRVIASKQQSAIAVVNKRHAEGLDRHGNHLKILKGLAYASVNAMCVVSGSSCGALCITLVDLQLLVCASQLVCTFQATHT